MQGPAETGSKEADTTVNAGGREPMDNVPPSSEDNPVQSGKPNKPEAKEQLLPTASCKRVPIMATGSAEGIFGKTKEATSAAVTKVQEVGTEYVAKAQEVVGPYVEKVQQVGQSYIEKTQPVAASVAAQVRKVGEVSTEKAAQAYK